MGKEFTVKEFVDIYKKDDATAIVKLIIKKYMRYVDKYSIAKTSVELSSKNKNKINVVSAKRYMLHTLLMINGYTNIKIDFDNVFEEFDLLNEVGLIDKFFGDYDGYSLIPAKEISECRLLLDMEVNDFMVNEMNTKNFVSDIVSSAITILSETLESVAPMLKDFAETVDDMDDTKKEKFVNKILKNFGKGKN